ncbi:hypothetical protein [Brevibacillus laterosporus]
MIYTRRAKRTCSSSLIINTKNNSSSSENLEFDYWIACSILPTNYST